MNKLIEFCEGVERRMLGDTWALHDMRLVARLRFFRDTGERPGVYSKEVTAMHFESAIGHEIKENSIESLDFARRLLQRTQEAGLNIHFD